MVASLSVSKPPPGPITTALFGPAGPGAVKTISPVGPAAAPSTTPAATTPPGAPAQPTGNQVPDDFFPTSASDLSGIAGSFQPASTDSDFPTQFTPPPQPQDQQFNAVHSWGSAAMMIALIGSAFTKQPMTSALNAGAQVMSAFKQNVDQSNTEAYNAWQTNLKTSYGIWKANAANAVQNHRYEMTYLEKIMSDNTTNDKDKLTRIMEFARATKNYGLMQIGATQGLPGAEDYMNKYATLGANLASASGDVDDLYNFNVPQDIGTAGGFPTSAGATSAPSLPTDPNTPAGMTPVPGGGYVPDLPDNSPIAMAELRAYLKNPFVEEIPSYVLNGFDKRFVPDMNTYKGAPDRNIWNSGVANFTKAYGLDPVAMSSRRSLVAGINGSIDKLTAQANQANASDASFNNAWTHVQQDLFTKGAPPDNLGPFINDYIQNGKVNSGDPNTVEYATAIGTMAEEYAKIISGSTGSAGSTVSAQEYARELFKPGFNKAQMIGAVQTAQANMRAREQGYSDTINQMQGFISAIPANYDSRGQQTSPDAGGDGGGYDPNAPPPTQPTAPAPSAPTAAPADSGGGGDGAIPVPPAYAKLKNGTSIYKGSQQYVIYNGMAIPVGAK